MSATDCRKGSSRQNRRRAKALRTLFRCVGVIVWVVGLPFWVAAAPFTVLFEFISEKIRELNSEIGVSARDLINQRRSFRDGS